MNDCTLLSIASNIDMPLSMFDPNNASIYKVGRKWSRAKQVPHAGDEDKNIKRLYQATRKPLQIVVDDGQWQLSGYLSIRLKTEAGQSLSRLYFFDPEGSTGTGFGP